MSNWVGSRFLIRLAACINGVMPFLSIRSTSSPLAIKYATISVWPNTLAKCIDEKPKYLKCKHRYYFMYIYVILPSASNNDGWAFWDKRKTTILSLPSRTAQCNGVEWSSPPDTSTCACLLIKYFAISTRLFIAAQWSNVILSLTGVDARCGSGSINSTTRS